MKNNFEVAKLKRLLRTQGKHYEICRQRVDKFKQTTNESEKDSFLILGVYHESQSFVSMQVNEGSITRGKKQPMIMTTFEDAKEIKLGDVLKHNDKQYKVVNVRDIMDIGVYADISLEVLDNGLTI